MKQKLKYNWRIFGQDDLLARLEDDIDNDRLSHAILLSGADRIGKISIIKKMAQILQCENEFCGVCKTCLDIEAQRHLDTFFYLTDSELPFGIDEVRELKTHFVVEPTGKIQVGDNPKYRKNEYASVKLPTKILEEPPVGVKFLLTCSDFKEVLPTVVSRCRLYRAKLVSDTNLKKYLTDHFHGATPEIIDKAILFSCSKAGQAIEILTNRELFEKFDAWNTKLKELETSTLHADVIAACEKFAELEDNDLSRFFSLLMSRDRNRLLTVTDQKNRQTSAELLIDIQKTYDQVRHHANLRLALEVLFLRRLPV